MTRIGKPRKKTNQPYEDERLQPARGRKRCKHFNSECCKDNEKCDQRIKMINRKLSHWDEREARTSVEDYKPAVDYCECTSPRDFTYFRNKFFSYSPQNHKK